MSRLVHHVDRVIRNAFACGLFVLLPLLMWITPGVSSAADKPLVGMKIEVMSIRNRSSGPLPVRIRLEYNQPQMLEGDLQLSIYDGQGFYTAEDLIAKIQFDDIVLVGQDYQFNAVLPPLRTSTVRNWSIEAVFVTDSGPIPLSSIADKQNPPVAFDLITSNPGERSVLVCSCSEDPNVGSPSLNRRFLENALSLDNYNPLATMAEEEGKGSGQSNKEPLSILTENMVGRSVIHFAGQWAARDLPVDPLSFCAFDVVLLSDAGLSRLNQEQISGLIKWVRAGGSVCVLPDAPMKPMHLEALRDLFRRGIRESTDLSLDKDGRLVVVSEQDEPVVKSHFGLGRALLLPAVEKLEERLTKEEIGEVVGFLWKVRKDNGIWNGKKWAEKQSFFVQLSNFGVKVQSDNDGPFITAEDVERLDVSYRSFLRFDWRINNGRYYLNMPAIESLSGNMDRINPTTSSLVGFGEQILLPEDVEMVPTWVIGLILSGYVLTIGPIDYFVLGWLRLRKFTWIVFPIVTLGFTFLTIAIAYEYMSSDDTGGRLVITDVVDNGIPARQTVLETLFLGAKTEITSEHQSELVIQTDENFTDSQGRDIYGAEPQMVSDTPLNYSGHFPQKYTVRQEVQQWRPVSLRTLSLEPDGVKLPSIPWDDATLVTTEDGRERLKVELRKVRPEIQSAVVFHNGSQETLLGVTAQLQEQAGVFQNYNPYHSMPRSRSAAVQFLPSYIPTMSSSQGFFRIVSQIAPQGAGSMEDLAFCDPSDPNQWALVIMTTDGEEFQVFRKLYLAE